MIDSTAPALAPIPNDVASTVSFGMGGDSIDRVAANGGGEDYLNARLKKIGIDTLGSVYQWSDTQKRFDDIRAFKKRKPKGLVAINGDSLGDNEIGDDVAALEEIGIEVDLIGGFQGSEWGKHTSITPNVKRAIIIYNPNIFETFALGAYPLPLVVPPIVPAGQSLYDGRWYLGNNGKTWVRYVQIEAPHPDDWGLAQDIIFAANKQLLTAN